MPNLNPLVKIWNYVTKEYVYFNKYTQLNDIDNCHGCDEL